MREHYVYSIRGMNLRRTFSHHKLFVLFFLLFLVVAGIDLFNFDSIIYKNICMAVFPYTNSPCVDFYDIPIWNFYLLLAVLTALYHVHGEVRATNRHLSSK